MKAAVAMKRLKVSIKEQGAKVKRTLRRLSPASPLQFSRQEIERQIELDVLDLTPVKQQIIDVRARYRKAGVNLSMDVAYMEEILPLRVRQDELEDRMKQWQKRLRKAPH